jgi:hypothetical protein
MTHLKNETLLNYLENHLSPDEKGQVETHLKEPCLQCGKRLGLLRKVLDTVTGDRTVAPPANILKQAVDKVKGRENDSKSGLWNRIVASLNFDSHLQLSSAATRGSGRARQMLFTTEQVDIDLKIKSSHKDHDLLGQILDANQPGGFSPAFVCLQNKDGQQMATETDALGQFAFHGVSSGNYDLVFDLESQEIAITGLEFRNE